MVCALHSSMWVTKCSLSSLWTFCGHEILERSNRYPGKGCLCERKWWQKINRYFVSSSRYYNMEEETNSWESKHKFSSMKKRGKRRKKARKENKPPQISEEVERERQRATVGEMTELSLWEKTRTINTSRSRAIHRHKDEKSLMEKSLSATASGSHLGAIPELFWQALSCSTEQPLRVQQYLDLLWHLLMGVVTGKQRHPVGSPVQRCLGGLLRK